MPARSVSHGTDSKTAQGNNSRARGLLWRRLQFVIRLSSNPYDRKRRAFRIKLLSPERMQLDAASALRAPENAVGTIPAGDRPALWILGAGCPQIVIEPAAAEARLGYRIWGKSADGVEGEGNLSHKLGKGAFRVWDTTVSFAHAHPGPYGSTARNEELDICGDVICLQLTGLTAADPFPAYAPRCA